MSSGEYVLTYSLFSLTHSFPFYYDLLLDPISSIMLSEGQEMKILKLIFDIAYHFERKPYIPSNI